MPQQIIDNSESGLNVRNALNEMFFELYGALPAPIFLTDQSVTVSQDILANSMVTNMFFTNISGDPTIRVGITPGGNEILDDTEITTYQPVVVQQYFQAAGTLYFTWVGAAGALNIRIDLIPNFN